MKQKFIVAVVALLFGGVAFAEQVDSNELSESSGETIEIEVGESQKSPESNGESIESPESNVNQIAESTESPDLSQNNSAESPTLIELVDNIYFENDGGFVGVDLGYSMIAWQSDYGRFERQNNTTQYTQKSKNVFGVSYGIVIGYKQFFNEYIGARYYARFGANHGAFKKDGFSQIDLLDYSANVDFLANVYANETLSFGLFVGLGIGGNTLVGKYVRDAKRNLRDIVANNAQLSLRGINIKTHTTHFDFAINAGFRLNVGANHGVELAARVPLLPKSVYNYALTTIGDVSQNDKTQEVKYSTSLYNEVKPNHSVMVRYVFSF